MKDLQDRINRHLSKLVSDYKLKMEMIALRNIKDFFKIIPASYFK